MAAALPGISQAAGIAGSVLGYVGAKEAAEAKASMYNYQAQVAQNNAIIARRNAVTEVGVGEERAAILGIAARQKFGAVRAAQGASGVAADQGTAINVQAGQKQAGEIDQSITRENAGRKATDFLTQEYGDLSQASLDKMGASAAIEEGDIKALSSLIGGASSVADKWMNLSKLGAV